MGSDQDLNLQLFKRSSSKNRIVNLATAGEVFRYKNVLTKLNVCIQSLGFQRLPRCVLKFPSRLSLFG